MAAARCYVSHNLTVAARVCERALDLENGVRIAQGPVKQVVEKYVNC
jgi:ABC-type polysaccharide/polyol phosphate transport system ATPase subunit